MLLMPTRSQVPMEAMTPPAGPDSTVATGFSAEPLKVETPPLDCMMRTRVRDVAARAAAHEDLRAHLSRAVAPYGLYYAPDPSSQSVCTIGGNIAELSRPQAKVLAESRGFRWVEVDYDELRGLRLDELRLF